jgi:hypothetical protein
MRRERDGGAAGMTSASARATQPAVPTQQQTTMRPPVPSSTRNRPRTRRGYTVAASLAFSLAAVIAPSRAAAQGVVITRVAPADTARSRVLVTGEIDALGIRSQGEFRNYVYGGLGAGGAAVIQARPSSVLGLRIEGGFAIYGQETKRVPLSNTVDRVFVDMTTSNNIAMIGVGPQLTAPAGAVRPYIAGTVGLVGFFTESSVNGSDDNYDFASSQNLGDGNLAWTLSSGFYIPIHAGKAPWSIDIGATYHKNGRLEYLKKGGIIDNNDGTITLNRIRSEADFLAFRIGVRIGA